MKQFILILLSNFLAFFSYAQPKTWEVDNAHSNLRFEVGWQDFSMRTGEFKVFTGTIETEAPEDLTKASIKFVVDAASVDVIADRLAMKVKSDVFLNVEVHPEITFTATGMTKTSDNNYVSTGKLSICGVEKDQEVSVICKGRKEDKKGEIFGIEVRLVVDRTRFGLDWGQPRLGDQITLVGHLLYH